MKMYLLEMDDRIYLVAGTDPVEAANKLTTSPEQQEKISVHGEYEIDRPIDVSKFWPFFTASPGRHA